MKKLMLCLWLLSLLLIRWAHPMSLFLLEWLRSFPMGSTMFIGVNPSMFTLSPTVALWSFPGAFLRGLT